jgi:hypothetical protein
VGADMTEKKDAEVYKAFCLRCFSPLTIPQIAVTAHSDCIIWETRQEAKLDYYLCKGCKEAIDEAMKKGVKGLLKDMDDATRNVVFVNGLVPSDKEESVIGLCSEISSIAERRIGP